jgi:hypothetical protein
MHKSSDQPMHTWITSIQHQIQVLKDLGSTLHDDEVILALTGGLDTHYNFLIVALDSIPDEIHMIEYVIECLINEETQSASQDLMNENSHSALNAQAKQSGFDMSIVICQGCNDKGHFQKDCPSACADSGGMEGKIHKLKAKLTELWLSLPETKHSVHMAIIEEDNCIYEGSPHAF